MGQRTIFILWKKVLLGEKDWDLSKWHYVFFLECSEKSDWWIPDFEGTCESAAAQDWKMSQTGLKI